VEATGVDPSPVWYWGVYLYEGLNDDYASQYSMTQNQPNYGQTFQMMCNNCTCNVVCPGDCTTPYYYGDTIIESDQYNKPINTCQITFRYLHIIFALTLLALIADAVLQLVIGIHILYQCRYPESHWGFTSNLHVRSVWAGILFLVNPVRGVRWLRDPTPVIYPLLPDVTPTPYSYILVFSTFVDFPYAIASIMWALFSGQSLSTFLAIASCGNVCLGFLLVYYFQFLEDIIPLYDEKKKVKKLSHQLLPIH
jgi:hypothetical protein